MPPAGPHAPCSSVGEAVPPALWRRMASSTRTLFWNVYGPTECTVNVTARRIGGGRPEPPDVGRPWPGVRLWVLEAAGLPAPVGARGELWAGGAQLARGYLGRPELTADRFRPDPFSGEPGARLYRTGDLGRWLPDGRIELLGRADQQVKLRGHRIELGEIEAQLLTHPLIREAAAGLRADPQGEPRLVAWFVPAVPGPDLQALRRWLGERLPGPLVPSVLVALAALPKTTSGKLDRRALPDPDQTAGSGEIMGSPADPIEGRLLELFCEVLGVQRVLPSASLFELGGHSLTALRLATRIRESFGVRIAVRRLFAIPTPAGLAAELRGMQREDSGLPPIRRAPRNLPDRPLPLSAGAAAPLGPAPAHAGADHLSHPGVPAPARRLDLPALAGALTEILRRHEALRTHFPLRNGNPVREGQEDRSAGPGRPAPARPLRGPGGRARGRGAADRRRGGPPPLRPGARAAAPPRPPAPGPGGPCAPLVAHHLVSDGWSAALFLRELSILYGAFTYGEGSPLPEPPVQYADWAVWQREQLQGEVLEAHLRWWTERLAGAPRVLDLPTDRPRPPVEDPAGASVPFSLPGPLVEALRGLARAAGATLYMALLAGFQALLARIAGQETVCVGTHVARRNHLEVEGLIGFFINTVVIRTDVTAAETGRALVGQVREAVFGAFAHQDLPFEHLVEALDLERDPRWSPLFQVSFALQNVPREEPGLPGLDVERLETGDGGAHFDLAATISETAAGADGALSYRTALFFASTVRRLAGHYRAFLEALAERPDAPLAALSFLTAAERHQILIEWAGPERALPDAGLPELLGAQAARTPGATAVVCGAASCTYRDLDRRSNRLARWLRRHGAGPEAVVAISVERSVEMVVGLLGILKSGAACLPIDPLNPRERQAFLLEDAGASILLTQERWAAGFQAQGRILFLLDRTDPTDRTDPSDGWGRQEEGSPPGALLHLWIDRPAQGHGPRGARAAQPLSLVPRRLPDPAGHPVAPGLLVRLRRGLQERPRAPAGGRDDRPGAAGAVRRREVLEAIRREAVTFLNTTPSQMSRILDQAAADGWESLETLRTLILGGEAAHWAELLPWLASGRCRAEILHMYGPSEASDTVSSHRATPAEITGIAAGGRLPVGRAADNIRLLVVDAGLQPLPIGVPGELCLAGTGVARGYLGRPALTAEKFVPDPFHCGERMYRTGDLARWLGDGSVEILGRIDHQVKIRGIRVEPAEVEAALTAHPAVAGAVVAAREGAAGDKRLIAWLVASGGGGEGGDGELPPAGVLREHLRASLPEVMIPAAFVPLAAFPLTPRGKIDRSALPDPEASRAEAAERASPRRRRAPPLRAVPGGARWRRDRRPGQLLRPRRALPRRRAPGGPHPRVPGDRAAGGGPVPGAVGRGARPPPAAPRRDRRRAAGAAARRGRP